MDSRCTQDLRNASKAYQRTCAECGLGPCKRYQPDRLAELEAENAKLRAALTEANRKIERLREGLKETLEIAGRNETGRFVGRARAETEAPEPAKKYLGRVINT